jgi:hypothetical protein
VRIGFMVLEREEKGGLVGYKMGRREGTVSG